MTLYFCFLSIKNFPKKSRQSSQNVHLFQKGGDFTNKVILMGRLTKDPEVRYSQGDNPMAVARYNLAVNRKYQRDGEPNADFINCVAFGRAGEFAEKYLKQGMKIAITGRIQTGSYTNKDGQKVYTTDIVVEEHEFAETKAVNEGHKIPENPGVPMGDEFMTIPEGIDEGLPFS